MLTKRKYKATPQGTSNKCYIKQYVSSPGLTTKNDLELQHMYVIQAMVQVIISCL